MAREKIETLLAHIGIIAVDESTTNQAIKNKLIHEFEDGMEYYSAIQHQCDCIITENQDDFYFSELEVMGCEAFLQKLQKIPPSE